MATDPEAPAPPNSDLYRGDLATRFDIAYQRYQQRLADYVAARDQLPGGDAATAQYDEAMRDLIAARDRLSPDDHSIELGYLLLKYLPRPGGQP
jgi:hypothetical protein